MIARRLFFLLLVLSPIIVCSQSNISIKSFGVNEGLSSGSVNTILQDKQGFIWIGTDHGLNRFDGISFRKYFNDPRDTTTISSDEIEHLVLDSTGKIWIAGLRTIDYYDPIKDEIVRFKKYQKPADVPKAGINKLMFLPGGKLMIGTSVGVAIIDTSSGEYLGIFGMKSGTPDSLHYSVTSLFLDQKNRIWIGTEEGKLFHYDQKSNTTKEVFQLTCTKENLDGTAIESIGSTEEGLLILATDCGARFFDPEISREMKLFSDLHFSDTLCQCLFRDVLPLGNNHFMILQQGSLVEMNFKNHSVKRYLTDDASGIRFGTGKSMLIDLQGMIWVGDYGAGVYAVNMNATNFEKVTADENAEHHVMNPYVFAFEEEGDSVYVGSNWGIDIVDRRSHGIRSIILTPGYAHGIRPVVVNGMIKGDSGSLWVPTRWSINGLLQLNPHTGKMNLIDESKGFPNARYADITKGPDGLLYISTSKKGIIIYNTHTGITTPFKEMLLPGDTLASNSVPRTFFDSKGRYWICTRNGLNCYFPSTKKLLTFHFNKGDEHSIPFDDVSDVTEDMDGVIWIATVNGFSRFNEAEKNFTSYSMKDGLPDNLCNAILADSLGYIWISTNYGLSRFDPVKLKFRNFSVNEGLQSMEFNGASSFYGPSGNMYFGGINGFNYFNPKDIKENTIEPRTYISELTIAGNKFELDSNIIFKKRIELKYNQNFLSFDFIALSYFMSMKNEYACKMEGIDRDWVLLHKKNSISYPNLPPGDYVLWVKAANNDGYWNEKGTYLIITIHPPFWKTKWFYTLCGLTGIFLVWFYIRTREKKLKTEKLVLENKVGERTNELRVEKEKLSEANKDIKDSINYASRIQAAILPPEKMWNSLFAESMVLYKPKDIVAGDFYFLERVNDKIIVAAADCTGHGVPGAMVSVVCSNALSRAVKEFELSDPGKILDKVTQLVLETFEKSESDVNDGMDISLLVIDKKTNSIFWAGANNPLWYVENGQMKEIKGDKQPIGKFENLKPFTTHKVEASGSSAFYLFTDGYADQFGGPQGKKFKYKQLQELLVKGSSLSLTNQKEKLDEVLENWKGTLEQVDDVLIVGIKI